ncbi:catechol 2,3-dioxygenase-like lactoylglutathione lyase family enzyme [Arthrobacter ginsengisoli]|uniref:Catechol 2,3-dioxygenase-like lactoylglutathione lyase family enzyme n=1 Tax=Arthrobacter ginsengisoli TaxID=1356565 RepID=A0ABU1UH66_9MICC|nr:VOC family protein [Arthrobacter ginsengisoli]MDR7084527.1 catechol 2,3-dioxygenase-like lactoylglutathione lyase family enzyme [Arthrobacter ginsengisoli]
MLSRFYVNPILPAKDGDRARRFYRDVLGLELLTGPTDDPMVFGAANGSSIAVSEMPDRVPPPYPMISFMVTGIEEVVEALKARGATFRPLAPASFAGVEGTAVGDVMDFGPAKSAFLEDSEGNVIALNEFVG